MNREDRELAERKLRGQLILLAVAALLIVVGILILH